MAGIARTCTGKRGGAGGSVSLPVLGEGRAGGPRLRPSRNARRRAMALALVHVAFVVHIGLWLLLGRTVSPVEPSESMYTLETGVVNAGAIFFALAIISTLLFGRFFCGWGCHIVALQDLCGWMLKKVGVRPRPFRSRLLLFVPLAFALYMFVWPTFKREVLAPLIAHETTVVAPTGETMSVREWPEALAWLGPVREFPGWSSGLVVEDFWATFAGPLVAIPFLLVCGFACVYFLGAKGFCTYGCPYGGFFAPADMLSPGRILVNHDRCEGCGHCTAACTSNVRVHEEVRDYGMVVDAGCMKCLDCVSVCPNGALRFGLGAPPIFKSAKRGRTGQKKARPSAAKKHDLTWPEEIGLAAVFLATFLAWRGLYGLIPMLMAIGVAGCVTYLVWTAWRLVRDRNVRLHNFQLRLNGRMRGAGWASALLILLVVAATAQGGAVQALERQGGRFDSLVLAPADAVFAGRLEVVTDAEREAAQRAAGMYRRSSAFWAGGVGMAITPETELRRAWMHAVLGEWAESEAALRRVMRRTEVNEDVLTRFSSLLSLQGRAGEAEAFLRESLDERPASPLVRRQLVGMLIRTGRLAEAERVMLEGVEASPESEEAAVRAADFLAAVGKPAEAEALVLRTLERRPGFEQMRLRFVDQLLRSGRADEAERLARVGVREAPESARMATGLATVLLASSDPGTERFVEGLSQIERAASLDPGLAAARQQRAIAWMVGGRVEEAIGEMREAARLAPRDPAPMMFVAQMLEAAGRPEESREAFAEAEARRAALAAGAGARGGAAFEREQSPTGGTR